NTAYSSSGSLEKFYVDEYGNKHSHLIDPRTGYPITNSILTTHIISPRCIKADAVATMCMILELEDAISMISNDPELEGIIIYNKNGKLQAWLSPGIRKI
ncbi:MAG: FAD:protein FMN transferase, partial [Cyclobacteriaceae bacterium]|nr:FAD:protein FMN transferase [Cyclobacteriaceae bacterium]